MPFHKAQTRGEAPSPGMSAKVALIPTSPRKRGEGAGPPLQAGHPSSWAGAAATTYQRVLPRLRHQIFMRFLYCQSPVPLENLWDKWHVIIVAKAVPTLPDVDPKQSIRCGSARRVQARRLWRWAQRGAARSIKNAGHHHAGHRPWLLRAIRRLRDGLRSALRGMP